MDIVEEAKKYALSEIEKFGTPHPVHFEMSVKKALELAEKLGADKKIVEIGAYLMDLKLGQAFKDGRLSKHVEMSAEAAKKFLNKFDIDEASKERIINCVEAHHGTVPFKCAEAEICANADCYRFIHPKGFFVYLTLLGKRDLDFSECLRQAEAKLDEKYKVLSLDVCKKELEEFYQSFKQFIKEAGSL